MILFSTMHWMRSMNINICTPKAANYSICQRKSFLRWMNTMSIWQIEWIASAEMK